MTWLHDLDVLTHHGLWVFLILVGAGIFYGMVRPGYSVRLGTTLPPAPPRKRRKRRR